MIALFIGRFQPFHNGHLKDIKDALKFSDKLIIAVGSSNEEGTTENPFSYEERKDMIEKALEKESITKYEIRPIPDINNDKQWVSHVINITGKVDIIITGNNWVKRLFEIEGFHTKNVNFLSNLNATIIRKAIKENKDWQDLVPTEVANYIRKIEGINRIKKINGIL